MNRTFMSAIGALIVGLLTAQVHAQITLRVDGDQGAVNGDGLSWSTSFKFLQDGLSEAQMYVNQGFTVEIWVAATGAANPYRPDRDALHPTGSGAQGLSFELLNNVALYGGFLGVDHPDAPETELSQRDERNNVTVLSGDLNGDDVGFLNITDNSYHVVYGADVDATSRLDGFTVQGGHAGGAADDRGGGILLHRSGAAIIRCTIVGNSAVRGGGVFTTNPPGSEGGSIEGAILLNCAITGNHAAGVDSGGGGFANSDQNVITIVNTLFNENYADDGTGGAIDNRATYTGLVLINCTIAGNHAPTAIGGGGGAASTSRWILPGRCASWDIDMRSGWTLARTSI